MAVPGVGDRLRAQLLEELRVLGRPARAVPPARVAAPGLGAQLAGALQRDLRRAPRPAAGHRRPPAGAGTMAIGALNPSTSEMSK